MTSDDVESTHQYEMKMPNHLDLRIDFWLIVIKSDEVVKGWVTVKSSAPASIFDNFKRAEHVVSSGAVPANTQRLL